MAAPTAGREDRGRLIRFLIDSSALWRLLRQEQIRTAWSEVVCAGVIGSCHPQRAEFRRSAPSVEEYEQMQAMFQTLYPDAPVPKTAWQWIDSAQYRLVRRGVHRSMSAVDLLICATAGHHGLTVLHDDADYTVAARVLTDLSERTVRDAPRDPGARG
ncbi:hypothetical protein BH20ACT5_BH20ACT5_01920 [soil metagenome]